MGSRKYGLTNITMRFEGRTLYRIIALKDFADVKAGELGGWVSNEDNLSQYGDCWIYDEAKCMDYSMICDNSKIFDNSEMHGYCEMWDNSEMHGDCKIYDDTRICGNSILK